LRASVSKSIGMKNQLNNWWHPRISLFANRTRNARENRPP
jgi:hypothetical protein